MRKGVLSGAYVRGSSTSPGWVCGSVPPNAAPAARSAATAVAALRRSRVLRVLMKSSLSGVGFPWRTVERRRRAVIGRATPLPAGRYLFAYDPVVAGDATFDDVLAANEAYADEFRLAGLEPVAAKGLAVLTCMDSRIEPLAMLGLRPGDAKILRNAGARVTDDVLRTLVLASYLLGVDRAMVVA